MSEPENKELQETPEEVEEDTEISAQADEQAEQIRQADAEESAALPEDVEPIEDDLEQEAVEPVEAEEPDELEDTELEVEDAPSPSLDLEAELQEMEAMFDEPEVADDDRQALEDRVSFLEGLFDREDTPPRMPLDSDGGFWAKITDSTSDGNNKWAYDFTKVHKTAAGYAGWAAVSPEVTGTARNTIEDMNAATGVQGNGIDVAHLDTATATFTIQPCPDNAIVFVRPLSVTVGGVTTTEYWFSYANGVDGTCD